MKRFIPCFSNPDALFRSHPCFLRALGNLLSGFTPPGEAVLFAPVLFAGQHLNHEPKAGGGSAKCLAGCQTTINTQFARIALIIEMKRKSIIRKKRRLEARCSSLKNGCCCESLAGLYSSSGEFCATSVEKGLSNNRLQGTGTLKVG